MPDAAAPESPAAQRPPLRLLADRAFGLYFGGMVLGTVGVWVFNIVAVLVAFEISDSALVVGLVSVCQFLPQILFGPVSGARADDGDRRRQAVTGRVLVAAGSGGLGLWTLAAGADGLPGAWPVLAASAVVGVGFVVGGPALNALLPSLVRPGEVTAAVTLGTVPLTAARAGGPALGALVAVWQGPGVALILAAVLNAACALVIALLPLKPSETRSRTVDGSVRAGVRYLRDNRSLVASLVGIAAVGLAADPSLTLAAPLADHLGGGDDLAGLVASSFGLGSVAGFMLLALARRSARHDGFQSSAGFIVLAVGLAGVAISPGPAIALAFLFAGGSGATMAFVTLTAQLQELADEHMRGRVMSFWMIAFVGTRPFAAVLDGALADLVSVRMAFVVMGGFAVWAAWYCRPGQVAAPGASAVTSSDPELVPLRPTAVGCES